MGIPMLRPALELSHITRLGVGGSRTERRREAPPDPDADRRDAPGGRHAGDRSREDRRRPRARARVRVRRDRLRRESSTTVRRQGGSVGGLRRHVVLARAHAGRARRSSCADAGAESPGESLLRILIRELGLGRAGDAVPGLGRRSGCLDGHPRRLPRLRVRRAVEVPPGRGRAAWLASRPGTSSGTSEKRERAVCAEGLGHVARDLGRAVRVRERARLKKRLARRVRRDRWPGSAPYCHRTWPSRLPASGPSALVVARPDATSPVTRCYCRWVRRTPPCSASITPRYSGSGERRREPRAPTPARLGGWPRSARTQVLGAGEGDGGQEADHQDGRRAAASPGPSRR